MPDQGAATVKHIYRITVERFHFLDLIHSHGWRALAPFSWDEKSRVLSLPFRLFSGKVVDAAIAARSAGGRSVVEMQVDRKLSATDRAELRLQVRRMLSLDEDLTDFHRVCRGDPELKFVHRNRSGRMLRSPTAFEDLIKTICTTNCSWQNTRKMCEKLCELDEGCFPRAEVLKKISPVKLARLTPVGYRARTIVEVARMTVAGELPLDEWAAQGRFEEIRGVLKSIWGIGPYALSHMLMLLGDYSTIPVDCEVLKYLQTAHFGGRKVSAKEAVGPYEKYERHQFLAFRFGRMGRRR